MRSKSEQTSAAGFLRRRVSLIALLALLAGAAPPAHAQCTREALASFGQPNPYGLPAYYVDQAGDAVAMCQAGACTGNAPAVCTALDQCHVAGICDAATGLCPDPTQPDGTACDDGEACTEADSCAAGTCQGRAITCTAPDACHSAGVCDPATGTCASPDIRCEDGDPCTADSCDPSSGCVFQPVGGFEAVTCLLVTTTLEPAVCRPMPAKIERLTARAASQIAAAASGANLHLQKQLLTRVTRTLKGATRRLRRIAKRRGLSPLCADALTRALGNLMSRVDQLRNTL